MLTSNVEAARHKQKFIIIFYKNISVDFSKTIFTPPSFLPNYLLIMHQHLLPPSMISQTYPYTLTISQLLQHKLFEELNGERGCCDRSHAQRNSWAPGRSEGEEPQGDRSVGCAEAAREWWNSASAGETLPSAIINSWKIAIKDSYLFFVVVWTVLKSGV